MKNNTIEWVYEKEGAKEEDIQTVLSVIPYSLPKIFINLMRECDGGGPVISGFDFEDVHFGKSINDMGIFLSFDPTRVESLYNKFTKPPEFFPDAIVAFSVTGNGDFVCFDYRTDPKTDNPPVVYWCHEAPEAQSVSFVAKSFDNFMDMLYEDEDEDEDE